MFELRGFDRTWHLNPLMNHRFSDEQMAISWRAFQTHQKSPPGWLIPIESH